MNDLQKQIQASSFNALSLVRKLNPTLVAQHIVGVQPMSINMTTFLRTLHARGYPKPKYNFSRAKWHVADLFGKGYNLSELYEWCEQHFGPQSKHSDAWSRWTNNRNSLFRFRDEKDYLWFVLRWGT